MDESGKLVVFSRKYDRYKKFHKQFEDAGVKLHTTILHSGWVDEDSIKAMSACYGINGGFMLNMQSEVKLCGAPVNTLRLQDLYKVDLSQYKVIIFANAFKVDAEMRSILKKNAKGKTYVFNYTAGILNPDYNIDNVEDLTGFRVGEIENTFQNEEFGYKLTQYRHSQAPILEMDFPLVEICNKGVEVLECYPNGKVLCAKTRKNGGTSILCAFPSLMAKDFRQIAEEAGCKMYAPVNTTVYSDNRILGIFLKNAVDYELTLEKASVDGKKTINVKIPEKGAKYYIFD